MWIVVQLFFSRLAISILALSSAVLRNTNTSSGDDLEVYTESERHKIERFRELMKDLPEPEKEYQRSDDFLIRWLRESDMAVDSASEMLKHALEWRKANQMDSVLTSPSFNFKNPPCIVEGFDKGGGAVIYVKVMGVDLRKYLTSDTMDNLRNHSAHCVESYIQASIRSGTKWNEMRMTQGVAIIDTHGMSAKQHACLNCIRLYKQLAVITNLYYPRSSKYIVIINAPRFARPVIEVTRPFLSPYFQKIIHVFGADKQEWTRFLLSLISKEELLLEYGGTRERFSDK